MYNIDRYVFKEGERIFADLEERPSHPLYTIEEGDILKFICEEKRYMGKLIKFGKEKSFYELINLKEVPKI